MALDYTALDDALALGQGHIDIARSNLDALVAHTGTTRAYRDQMEGVIENHDCLLDGFNSLKALVQVIEAKVTEIITHIEEMPGPPSPTKPSHL